MTGRVDRDPVPTADLAAFFPYGTGRSAPDPGQAPMSADNGAMSLDTASGRCRLTPEFSW